ncbi:putative protein OS=Tsukamurella paurometabola (strain ATCC 8368 / DSM / CCUG 35730 /CIP 100753 / JCM 10117 / KCTC 9821 / NBRC 16120 / NCIMB 702349/ NCTC 13040) OX=521096 GN=Tpau_0973 PE=4 SV=1 [Tsukamurella paurometabola]|uniref:Uncharacterized protein n=1 Tax=Tsukamurella paurometabola (strain ATCC 8368 / DSM 20162 / CCUG 35730 / CIP 100753 / JCM 10117 / KCTC 9821 / NBRC 16120 / NCIMB 702349 / NCTC 13040) TaxID=521096 RepID=D5UUN5_TSUPD|nr:hypothetical protein [Tsukamurella paurometabola]ADG77606.1 hypothetical protein Tpau_0973 [Tsukamurella paurometabola DSM 20162]SUP27904.1 Uncharacterised protein [Tsukamurella paurometabola]
MTDTTLDPRTVDEFLGAPIAEPSVRQQIMILYTATSALDSAVIGWSRYDGTGRTTPTMGDGDQPPYRTGVDALVDGWRLFQASQLLPPARGGEHDTSYLPYEFWLSRLVTIDDRQRSAR